MIDPEEAANVEPIDRLRDVFAAATSASASVEGQVDESADESIDPERIWAAARGELDREETSALVDRLHVDAQLATEWRLAVELSAAEGMDPPIRTPVAGRRGTAGALVLAAAAAICLVVLQDDGSTGLEVNTEAPRLRGSAAAEGEATLSSPIADGARVALTGFDLSWSARAGASRYELRVRTEALDPVFEALELQATHARVPAGQLASFEPGRRLIWQVTAVMDDGTHERGPIRRVVLE